MISVAVNGAAGRMGCMLVTLISEHKNLKLVQALEYKGHPQIGKDAGEVAGVGNLGVAISDNFSAGADVVIDFSAPDSTVTIAEKCLEFKTAMVVGTTGLGDKIKRLEEVAKDIPVIVASNTSVGVNLLFKIAADIAKVLGEDYDIEIVEAHHRFKADAPSGTALKLSEVIAEAVERNPDEVLRHGREGQTGARTKTEIGMHSMRAGDIVGEHTVVFGSLGDRFEITHRASDRKIFASGALRAAEYLAGKESGWFSMNDVLNI